LSSKKYRPSRKNFAYWHSSFACSPAFNVTREHMPRVACTFGPDVILTRGKKLAVLVECNGSDSWLWKGHGAEVLEERMVRLQQMREQYGENLHCLFAGETFEYALDLRDFGADALPDPWNIMNPPGLRKFCRDKGLQKRLSPPRHTVPARECAATEEAVTEFLGWLKAGSFPAWMAANPRLIDPATHPYLVIKKPFGSVGGKGVRIRRWDDRAGIRTAIEAVKGTDGKVILEGCGSSDPITHPETGRLYAGVVRFNMDALVDTDKREFKSVSELSCWRLAAEPLDSDAPLDDRLRVTAYCEVLKTTREEHAIARAVTHALIRELLANAPELFEHQMMQEELIH
jgi:hypothetical protein